MRRALPAACGVLAELMLLSGCSTTPRLVAVYCAWSAFAAMVLVMALFFWALLAGAKIADEREEIRREAQAHEDDARERGPRLVRDERGPRLVRRP